MNKQTFCEILPKFEDVHTRFEHVHGVQGVQAGILSISPSKCEHSWPVQLPQFARGIAIHRIKVWWGKPLIFSDASKIAPETFFILLDCPSGESDSVRPNLFTVLITLVDKEFRSSFWAQDGHLKLVLDSDDAFDPTGRGIQSLLVVTHHDPYDAVHDAVNVLRNMCKAAMDINHSSSGLHQSSPEFVDYFGWCTWDSYYLGTSRQSLVHGVRELRRANVLPRFIIIDDSWQGHNVDLAAIKPGLQWDGLLTSFSPNARFTNKDGNPSLSETIAECRALGIQYVLPWHAFIGYWRGLDPDSAAMQVYKPQLERTLLPKGIQQVTPEELCSCYHRHGLWLMSEHCYEQFYDDYHRLLKEMGATGVKVDVQSIVGLVGTKKGCSWELANRLHRAMRNSIIRNFGGKANVIHCMCHGPENLGALAACYEHHRTVIRTGDDYWPTVDSSHGPHLFINAYNSLLISQLGIQDWDMFQSNCGRTSALHAAGRAISGGPVYVSDRAGEHGVDILRKVVFNDGSIPRPSDNALPCRRVLFNDPQRECGIPLAVFNANPIRNSGVVAVFNVLGAIWDDELHGLRFLQPSELSYGNASLCDDQHLYSISWDVYAVDIEGIRRQILTELEPEPNNTQFVAYRHSDRSLQIVAADTPITTHLPAVFDFDIITFSPLIPLTRNDGHLIGFWSSIGAVGMYNTGGAVRHQEVSKLDMGVRVDVALRGDGEYWFVYSASMKPCDIAVTDGPVGLKFNATWQQKYITTCSSNNSDDDVDELILMHLLIITLDIPVIIHEIATGDCGTPAVTRVAAVFE